MSSSPQHHFTVVQTSPSDTPMQQTSLFEDEPTTLAHQHLQLSHSDDSILILNQNQPPHQDEASPRILPKSIQRSSGGGSMLASQMDSPSRNQSNNSRSHSNGHGHPSPIVHPNTIQLDGLDHELIDMKPVLLSAHSFSTRSMSAVEPTTLQDALRALRDAQEEIAHLQARLGDELAIKPFESRGMDHTEALREQSQSHTRNDLEQQYEDAAHGRPSLSRVMDEPAVCCGCFKITPTGSHRPQMTVEQYFMTPMWVILFKRLPWLLGLLILQSFSATILASYDSYLEAHIIVTYFVPVVVGTGGNAGNQCSVMITRALALGMGDAEVLRVIKKEAPIAVITAILLAFSLFLRISIEYPHETSQAGAIAITLGVSVLISIALGILFSYGIEKIRRCDPADGATPLLSTISDLIGIALLCGIAVSMVS